MAIEATSGLTNGLVGGVVPTAGQNPPATQPATIGVDQHATKPQGKSGPEAVKPAGHASSTAAYAKQADANQDRVKEATQMLNDFMKHYAIELQFKIEDNQTIVKVLNKQTGDVIRQIPSEEAVRLSKALDTLQGLIIQQKV